MSRVATKTKRDYYEILSVERTCTDAELKTAYRKLAMQYHPDRNPAPEAEEKFKEASEAYGVLSDTDKRAAYDRFGHAGVNGGSGFGAAGFENIDLNDIFGDLFGDMFSGAMGGGSGRRRSRAQRGNDVREDLSIKFEEAVFGVKKQIKVRRNETCEDCTGTGSKPGTTASSCKECGGRGQLRFQQGFFSVARTCMKCGGTGQVITDPCAKCKGHGRVLRERSMEIDVPAGVEDETRIRYGGQGEAGLNGGPAGDMYVVLQVAEHEFFEREGTDLYCTVPISFPQSALGAEIMVPTLYGDHKLKVPEGTQSGHRFRIKNKGVPVLQGSGRGDLYVDVQVHTPEKLTKQQRELLEQLSLEMGVENLPQKGGLFSKVKDIFG